MGISMNGPSGIDTAYIIESLVSLEQEKVTRVESQKKAYQVKVDAYSKLLTFVNDIGKQARGMKTEEDFNLFTTESSNDEIVTFSASTGGVAGSYSVDVFQTAQREKLISADKLITDQSASLSSLGIAPGTFSINGIEMSIDADDTIQDLRLKINTTTDADGNKAGVTATVLKLADDNFRMILTSDDTGDEGAALEDLAGGTVLQDLGLIVDAAGDKGIQTQSLQSADDIASAFAALAEGETIEYSGLDHFGNEVSNTFLKTATNTIDDFVAQVSNTFHSMVDVSVSDVDGTLSITDKIGGTSKLALSTLNIGGTDYSVATSEVGYSGGNVLSLGVDAYFSIDGIGMSTDKNSVKDVIAGVTLDFHKASFDETVTIDMDRDFEGITKKVTDLLDSYNALVRYVKSSTKYGNAEEGEEGGKLAGDSTARAMLDQIKSVFQKNLDITGTSPYSSMNMVGLKTNIHSGEFEIDTEKFKEAVTESFDDVVSLFITKGYSDNSNIVMGKFSEDTDEGVYTLEEVDNDYYRIQSSLPPSTTWYQSDLRSSDIISFGDGPAQGLMLTAPIGSGNATFTFSKGLAGHLEFIVDKLSDSKEGTIAMRQESWNKSMERIDDRIIELESRVESYRIRLVKEFAAMEQTLNQLNSQSANMMSQLGFYTQ